MSLKHVKKYELSPTRIKTVRSYAREYTEWVKMVRSMPYPSKTQRMDEPRGNAKGAGRPTERLAIRRANITKKIDLIERTAREADPFHWKYLLKGVTEGKTYEFLFAAGMPCSRNTYYTHRRRFYWMLSEKMYKLGV